MLFRALYGNGYEESYQIARALVFLPVLLSARVFCMNVFIAAKKNRAVIMSFITSLVLALSGLLFFLSSLSFRESIIVYMYVFNGVLLSIFASIYLFLRPIQVSLDKE
jgi:O-antigen/teichoic acid export membrane protein